jgi:glycyl-tRNA synthetase
MAKIDMAKFAAFCKDNGFIFQSSEIYGGINGFWDYGPLGVELKKNIKDAWWLDMVRNPPPGPDGQEIRMVGLDCSIIMNPKVWVASGHVGGFQDPMSGCKHCKKLFRSDHVWDMLIESDWVKSLLEYIGKKRNAPTIGDLRFWADSKGKKLAPNLALIRNFDVTVSWMQQEIEATGGTHYSFSDAKQLLYRVGTEQRSVTGDVTPCPACGGELSEPRAFNLMFETNVGAVVDSASSAYLRPETAQGIFVNYRNVLNSTRLKLPFGIAQVGKSFRNEVTPRNFIFRSREFEQMEIEFFCHPAESMKWYEYWRDLRKRWYSTLGIQSGNLRPREQTAEERAFYSIGTTDIEYLFPFSDEPQELEGVAHRADYDLTQHAKHSGKADDLAYFDEELWNNDSQTMSTRSFKEWLKSNPTPEQVAKYKFVPHVIEPSAGADRFTLAVLCEAFTEEEVKDAKGNAETRTVMRFHPRLAPIKCAVFPLVNKEGMPEKALALYRQLKPHFNVVYDDKGAVGRRYRRMDEVGTPFCVTIDGDTMKDDTVTIRERDSMAQRRIPISQVKDEVLRAISAG